ncbi:MAG: porin [Candidatus Aminicenantes bacterium]|nr:porin [Candidatus Aminicenantes bacterium]
MKTNKAIFLLAWALPALGLIASAQDKAAASAVTAAEPLKISGYAQVLSTTQSAGVDGLSVRRVRLALAGEISKTIKIKAEIDALKSPALIDAQIDWTPAAAAGLRIGQFKVPFSLENMTSTSDLDWINLAQAVSKLVPGQDNSSNGRDIGLALTGKASLFEYYLGVFNGAGINKADTNDQKDIAARLVVRPLSGLALGASLYNGCHSATAGAAPVTRDRAGFEAAWVSPTLSLKAELIRAADAAIHKQGWYAQAGYFVLPKKIQALIRFDSLDVNRDQATDRVDIASAGLTWFIVGKTKIQVNYEHTRNEAGAVLNRAFLVKLQIGY